MTIIKIIAQSHIFQDINYFFSVIFYNPTLYFSFHTFLKYKKINVVILIIILFRSFNFEKYKFNSTEIFS